MHAGLHSAYMYALTGATRSFPSGLRCLASVQSLQQLLSPAAAPQLEQTASIVF